MNLGGPSSVVGSSVQPVNVPPELTNLQDLAQLPAILGAFLALLALAALSYILMTSGRVRKVELAVLAVPVVLVVANAVAIWPARKAAHRSPAEAYRSE
ncbi:MAG: hypothetical protein ABSE77_03090 [Acidimicrobiales bacterium]